MIEKKTLFVPAVIGLLVLLISLQHTSFKSGTDGVHAAGSGVYRITDESHLVHLPIVAKSISEYGALMALYNSTNGPGWHNETGWGLGDPCDPPWYGVTCNEDAIWSLDLPNNHLVGFLPPELGSLRKLERLYLGGNQLTYISPGLGNLRNLERLSLGTNQLTSFPQELGRLENLTRLWLSDNQLSSIPPELGNLRILYLLDLGRNQLASIPAEFSKLTNMRVLVLSGNNLTTGSIQGLAGLNRLGYLALSDNQLSGNIPDWFANLTSLDFLYLDSNNFSGVIPAELSNLDLLVLLWLNGNPSLGCWETQASLDWALSLWYCRSRGNCGPGYAGPTDVCPP